MARYNFPLPAIHRSCDLLRAVNKRSVAKLVIDGWFRAEDGQSGQSGFLETAPPADETFASAAVPAA
jgi:hypothetical protein